MTIEQTVEIPASRRITIEVPPELPIGKARIELTITPETMPKEKTVPPLASLAGIDKGRDTLDAYTPETMSEEKTARPLASFAGIHKGLDTMDAYFARKRADKEKEDAQFERQRQRATAAKNALSS